MRAGRPSVRGLGHQVDSVKRSFRIKFDIRRWISYFGINGYVLSRNQKGNYNRRDSKNSNLEPKQPAFHQVLGMFREGCERVYIPIEVYNKRDERDRIQVTNDNSTPSRLRSDGN